ncbi:MAG: D-alanyl-D-alanine carboxypeptidase family protein [Acidimicrobiales bacterium]
MDTQHPDVRHGGIRLLRTGLYLRIAIAVILSAAILMLDARLSRPIPMVTVAPMTSNGTALRSLAVTVQHATKVPDDPSPPASTAKEPRIEPASAPSAASTANANAQQSLARFVYTSAIQGLAWPGSGGGAVGVSGPNLITSHGPVGPVPIASLTKMMTAYIILQDHPLTPGQSGPDIRIDSTDVDITYNDELNDETMVPVARGELLTEKQALEGLLVHSACNLAYTLARWDSGSVTTFVAKMNTTARKLGLDSTSYAGPAGFSPASVSTPADLVMLATIAMSIPAFAQIVDHPTITLPVAGTLYNYVSAIGQDGVIGIKSGFNYQSEGCVVLAATRYVDGKPVLLIAAVTGQGGMDPLGSAQSDALALIDSVPGKLHRQEIVVKGHTYMHAVLKVPWQPRDTVRYGAIAGATIDMIEWPGASPTVYVRFVKRTFSCNSHIPDTKVATITVTYGVSTSSVPLLLTNVPTPHCPSLLWRVIHG